MKKNRIQSVLWMLLILALLTCGCSTKKSVTEETIIETIIPYQYNERNMEDSKEETIPDDIDGKDRPSEETDDAEVDSYVVIEEAFQNNASREESNHFVETESPVTPPISSTPIVTESAKPMPSTTKPTDSQPIVSESVESQPTATEPVESQSTATEPVESQPTATKPVESPPTANFPTETAPLNSEQQQPILGENELIIT